MSLVQRYIEADFNYAQGQFQGGGGNSYTARGLRMSARITTPGGWDAGNLSLSIFGMTESTMNQLTILPTEGTSVGQNTIVVRAGDTPNPQAIAFSGTVDFAYEDGTSQPQVCLRVQAHGGLVEKIMPTDPTSVQGTGDVDTIMGQIAQKMGRTLENTGVSTKLQNVYLPGSPLQQVEALARAAGCQWTLEKDVLAIWPTGKARQGSPIQINKTTGLVGYPAFVASGILVTTLFQGTIKFGSPIHVQSGFQPACGDWYVKYMEHALDCMTPNGRWFTSLEANKIKTF